MTILSTLTGRYSSPKIFNPCFTSRNSATSEIFGIVAETAIILIFSKLVSLKFSIDFNNFILAIIASKVAPLLSSFNKWISSINNKLIFDMKFDIFFHFLVKTSNFSGVVRIILLLFNKLIFKYSLSLVYSVTFNSNGLLLYFIFHSNVFS